MQHDLLETARRQAETSDPPIRAAAFLRIARAESPNLDHARSTLLQALDAIRSLPDRARQPLFDEARMVAAAVAPDLLAEIPITPHNAVHGFASVNIVQTMLTHGHIHAAFDFLLHHDDPASFPFLSVTAVVHRIDPHTPQATDRRLKLLRHAVELWRQSPTGFSPHRHGSFTRLFSHLWDQFPPNEALAIAHTIVDRADDEPDDGISSGYANEVHFTSPRQDTLFQILHVLRHLDPTLAQSLIGGHPQLALAARRYPNGLETFHQEMEAETERRKAEGATCGGGFLFAGDSADLDRQRRLFDATRSGDFEPSIHDALEKYQQDTAPDTRNHAPKAFWPSTGAFRTLFYQAGKRLGPDAATLLDRAPDDDLRLFATIELAAALANVPPSSITTMKQPRPPDARGMRKRARIISSHSSPHAGPPMRSPDGRLIRCPKCKFEPPDGLRWRCKCGHAWNTFWTAGNCPACHFQWQVTQCPSCGQMSDHQAWYVAEP